MRAASAPAADCIPISESVRPFRIDTPQAQLDDLRGRLQRTRWPEPATEAGWVQGVPLDYLRELCGYWADGYNWRATETRINAIDQFVTTIDGIDMHFLHVRSGRADAVPLIMTHGWPGSFFEFEQAALSLANPTGAAQAFDVVVPSLPGYGYSGRPARSGWDVHRVARAWAALMQRLGYGRFIAVGSDWGTSVATSLALQLPDRLHGIHLVPPLAPPDRDAPDLTAAEAAALRDLDEPTRTGSAYSAVHATKPQTIGYALLDSPAALCAWIVDKVWSWSDHDGHLDTVLSRDQVLDDVTLYWLTGTGASSARLYWESIAQVTGWFTRAGGDVIVTPTAGSAFPKEVPRPSRRWAARRFADIVYWSEPDRGGHFAAWEQPALFAAEVRAAAAALLGRGG